MGNRVETLFAAIVDDDPKKVKELIQESQGWVKDGFAEEDRLYPELVHWIYRGDSPLHFAAAGYRVAIAKMLLAGGADPCSGQNRRRSTPLHYASDGQPESPSWNEEAQVGMIRLLLDSAALIDAQDNNGATALHRAVRTRCAAAVQSLLLAGADPSLRNKPGSTAFHLAVQNTGRGGSGGEAARTAQQKIIRMFLARGVSPRMKDAKGLSVLDWAKNEGIREILMGKVD